MNRKSSVQSPGHRPSQRSFTFYRVSKLCSLIKKSDVNVQVDTQPTALPASCSRVTRGAHYGRCFNINYRWIALKDTYLYAGGSAVVFLIWSVAFFSFYKNKAGLLKLLANGASVLVLVVAILNIANSCFDLDLGLTHPFIALGDAPLNFPGPLLADSAFSFLILSVATALMQFQNRKQENFHKFAALILLIPNAVIVGSSIVGLQSICTFFGCIKPSLAASLSFIFAGLAIIFAYPDKGITEYFTHNTLAGRLMRCIFLALLPCIPILALLSYGQIHGLYDQSIANGLMALTLIALFIAGIAWGAKNVEALEAEKTVALQLLQDSIDSFVPESNSSYKLVCLECGKEFSDDTLAHCPDDGSQLGKLADKLKIGSVFADSYEIVSYIGSGGCSLIYEAKHMLMNKQVALKLLRSNFSTETKYVQRFQRESKATSKLVHTNIVVVHDFGISLAGQPYIVMDFLKGMSLESRIELAGALHWRQAVPIFIDICEGLVYAHKNGVLHRDLKPANIMLVDEEYGQPFVVKIVDFGLAKIIDNTDMQLTQTGELLGSPTYMSPEQCKADPVDHRTDIYSLGALIYHALSGQPAVQTGNVYEALRMQIEELPAPFPDDLEIPLWLSNLTFRALEKAPEHRQQSMTEILNELKSREFASHEKSRYS